MPLGGWRGPASADPSCPLSSTARTIAVAIDALSAAAGGSGALAPITLLSAVDIAPNSGLEASVLNEVHGVQRPITDESTAVPTAPAIKQAIDGSGITAG